MAYKVIAECVDVRSGKRYLPGETFDPAPDADQAERLTAAKAIEVVPDDGAKRAFLALALDDTGRGLRIIDTTGFAFAGIAVGTAAPTDPEEFHWQPLVMPADADDDDDDDGGSGDAPSEGGDGLEARGVTVPDLQEIAKVEEVDLTGITVKADIIAAIRAKRADASSGE